MVVSHYLDGAPARAEILDLAGQTHRVPLGDGPLTDLGRPVDEVDHVRQYLPNAQLRELSLIDTPGTATLTVENEARTRRMLIDGQQDTRRASSWADCIVFLADSAPREDERTFLSQLGMTPLTMIGVLSRADSFGQGAFGRRDPIDHAREHSDRILRDLAGAVSKVMPLSGLLAESALTGRVNNDLARDLAQLVDLDREEIIEVIEVADPATLVPGLDAAGRDRLLDVLGEYGMIAGRRIAAEQGAVGLLKWLTRVSGVEDLVDTLTGELRFFAELQRAVRVLDLLEDLAGSHPEREHVRWVRSVTLAQPAMHFVLLYRSYRDTYRATPDSRLLPQLHRAIVATTPAEVVDKPADTPAGEIRAELEHRLGELQQLAMTPLSAAEDEARERLIGACQQALQALN